MSSEQFQDGRQLPDGPRRAGSQPSPAGPQAGPGGEEVAALYRDLGPELRAFLTGVLRDRELAEECLQNVFRKTLEQLQGVRDNVRGWLFRVAFHEAMLVRRKLGRERDVLRSSVWEPGRQAGSTSGGQHRPAEAALVQSETVALVRDALAELPLEQQQVVRMRIYEDKTFAVIAAELNLPLGTVLTRMRLATEKLERKLQRVK